MKNKMNKSRVSIRKKTVRGILLLSFMLITALNVTLGVQYRNITLKRYNKLALSYAKEAAEIIDGDKVYSYLYDKNEDEYFYRIEKFINSTCVNSDMQYLYVYYPDDDGAVYIWDCGESDEKYPLGYKAPYERGEKELADNLFSKNPKTGSYISREDGDKLICTGYPVYDSEGNPVAIVGVDISIAGVNSEVIRFIIRGIISVFFVLLLAMIVYYYFSDKMVMGPLHKLNMATKEVVKHIDNGENMHIDITTNDEIEDLAESFEEMSVELNDYVKRLESVTAEKERIGAELNIATQIQADMLPRIFPPFPDRDDLDIYASMTPAKEVGGDFYDFFLIDDKHLAMVMADVSGKGVPAALFMVIAKTLIKNRALMGGKPSEILEFVNNQLCENNEAEMFVTVWLGIINLETGLMTAANAGHEYPAIKKKDGRFELFKDKHGFVLAGMENVKYKDYEIQLEKNDIIFLYTDGVAEAADSENNMYGTDRMLDALNGSDISECRHVVESVRSDINSFVKEAPQFDDITMLCLKLT